MFATCSITVGSYAVFDGAGSFFHLMLYRKGVVISKWVIEIKKVELGSGDEYKGFIFFSSCVPLEFVHHRL